MSNFSQSQGNQRVERRRTFSTPHNTILKIDKEIAEKGHLESETLVFDFYERQPMRRGRGTGQRAVFRI